jgi:hypothetical protein
VGYLAIPGLVYALVRRGEGSLERRFAAFAALGFTLQALATYGGFDPTRYLLLGVACLWFTAFAFVDGACTALAARVGTRWGRSLARGLPAALAIALFVSSDGLRSLDDSREAWSAYRSRGTARGLDLRVRALRSACPVLAPDALVASDDPWQLYLWCGNAGLRLPQDLDDVEWVDRYLEELKPGYIVIDQNSRYDAFRSAPRLRRIASPRPFEVYRVENAGPESRTWVAPPPLTSIGLEAESSRP